MQVKKNKTYYDKTLCKKGSFIYNIILEEMQNFLKDDIIEKSFFDSANEDLENKYYINCYNNDFEITNDNLTEYD